METIILNTVIVSCIVSALFVLIRVYFAYFAKRNCSDHCKCSARDLADVVTSPVAEEAKPKRTRKPKHSGESKGDFALEATAKLATAKKKPGRKKKAE